MLLGVVMSEDDFKKVKKIIDEDPNINDFQKKRMTDALFHPDPEWNEDEFLSQFPPDVVIFLIEHFPYPIPKYLLNPEQIKKEK